jgi:hypothetical protein
LLIPLAPFSIPLYLLGNPPCCDRILPLWFQVADKLIFPFPSPCLYTPHSRWVPTPWGCPELNIHLNGLAYTRPSMVWNTSSGVSLNERTVQCLNMANQIIPGKPKNFWRICPKEMTAVQCRIKLTKFYHSSCYEGLNILLGTLFDPCRLAYLTYNSNDCWETPLTMNFST